MGDQCLIIQGFFAGFKTMRRKQNLASLSLCNPKIKLGDTMHFLEVRKLQFGRKTPYFALYFIVF